MRKDARFISRMNGSLSKGPVSERGKQISSRNATKHGIFSRVGILEGESVEEFDALFARICEEQQAVGVVEESLCERIAIAMWRQRRLTRAERAVLYDAARDRLGYSSSSSQFAPDHPNHEERLKVDRAMVSTIQYDKVIRYQTAFDNEITRALKCLHASQNQRLARDKVMDSTIRASAKPLEADFTDAVVEARAEPAPEAYNPT
jgi:hypothetical protein